jgi:hypothetical protein
MTPAMRTSTRVAFSGSRSTEPSLLATWKYGLSAFLASESSAFAGDQASSAAVASTATSTPKMTRPRPLCGASGVSKIRIALLRSRPADAAGVERSIESGGEGNSKRCVSLPAVM